MSKNAKQAKRQSPMTAPLSAKSLYLIEKIKEVSMIERDARTVIERALSVYLCLRMGIKPAPSTVNGPPVVPPLARSVRPGW